MQLVRAHVTYYRSVEDSEEFEVEPDVTCLVGKNESGKTNVAQALFRVNPVEPAVFDEVIDFPARMTAKKRDFKAGAMIPVVVATFRYEDRELAKIEADLGPGALTSSRVHGYGWSPDGTQDLRAPVRREGHRQAPAVPAGPRRRCGAAPRCCWERSRAAGGAQGASGA